LGTDPAAAVVFMYAGQWVAQCPRPGCLNVEKMGRCDDGTIGGLAGARFECRLSHGGCGLTCAPEWPADVTELEAVLLARPVPMTRNWRPGEDIRELLAENAEQGIEPTDQQLRAVVAAVTGRVPALAAARERLQIGA
jgi:hypothetical protein